MGELDKSGIKGSIILSEKFILLVEHGIYDYISSRIFKEVIPKQPTVRDFSFHMRCVSLNFVTLNNLVQKMDIVDDVEYLSRYLGEVTIALREMDKGGSVYQIIGCVEKAINLINDLYHIVLGSKSPPGSEDILPLFLFCLFQARLQRGQTIFYFIDLMIAKEDRRGKDGFNFAQIETGVQYEKV